VANKSVWAAKVAGLIQSGNSAAALAQIRVAPTVRDISQLRKLLEGNGLLARNPTVDQATHDQIVALSAPRLHRSP
jgi:hypothetical protein